MKETGFRASRAAGGRSERGAPGGLAKNKNKLTLPSAKAQVLEWI